MTSETARHIKSGRTLDRYLRVLEQTPTEVQDAVARDDLPLTVAEKVGGLLRPQEGEIARLIREGGKPREVVRPYLANPRPRERCSTYALADLMRAVRRGVAELSGRLGEVGALSPTQKQILAEGVELFRRLRPRADEVRRPSGVIDSDARVGEAFPGDPEGEEE